MRDLKRALDPVQALFNLPENQRSRQFPKWARREGKARAKEAGRQIRRILEERAELLMDGQLRGFLVEFNNRLNQFGPKAFPTSFNVLEAFLDYHDDPRFFGLLRERDHLFSFSDFIDFVTGPDAPADPFVSAFNYTESEIYSFNLYDDPHDLTFSSGSGFEYAVGGMSLVRHGSELSLFLVGGRVADLEGTPPELLDLSSRVVTPGKEKVVPHPDLKRRPEPLADHSDLWKTIALVRFDLASRSEQVRYVLQDNGDHYSITSDDPEIYAAEVDRDFRASVAARLAGHAALFEVCKAALLLGEYFRFKITLVRDERVEPHPADSKKKSVRSKRKRFGYSARVVYKTVAALRIVNPATRAVRRFVAPRFRVEVDGFWRRLPLDEIGHSPDGSPTRGRTWIKSHERWRDLPEKPIEVLVKSRVSIARARAAAEEIVKRSPSIEPDDTLRAPPGRTSPPISREEVFRQRSLLTSRVRWAILQRDDFRCVACGADAATDRRIRLDVDHIQPVSVGGKTEPENLRTLCSSCNNGKGDLIE